MMLEQREFKCCKELMKSLKYYPRLDQNQITMISFDHSLGQFKITGPSESADDKKEMEADQSVEQEETFADKIDPK